MIILHTSTFAAAALLPFLHVFIRYETVPECFVYYVHIYRAIGGVCMIILHTKGTFAAALLTLLLVFIRFETVFGGLYRTYIQKRWVCKWRSGVSKVRTINVELVNGELVLLGIAACARLCKGLGLSSFVD